MAVFVRDVCLCQILFYLPSFFFFPPRFIPPALFKTPFTSTWFTNSSLQEMQDLNSFLFFISNFVLYCVFYNDGISLNPGLGLGQRARSSSCLVSRRNPELSRFLGYVYMLGVSTFSFSFSFSRWNFIRLLISSALVRLSDQLFCCSVLKHKSFLIRVFFFFLDLEILSQCWPFLCRGANVQHRLLRRGPEGKMESK